MGDPVTLWAFDLPFMAVYADYYVLARSTLQQYFWLLDKKTRHDSLPVRGFHFGHLIAPPDLLATANIVHLDHDTYDVRATMLTSTTRPLTWRPSMPRPNFERDIIAAFSSPTLTWSSQILDVIISGLGSGRAGKQASYEQLALGDETGVQGRLNERLCRAVTAYLQAQGYQLRIESVAAGQLASEAARFGYARVPDLVILEDDHSCGASIAKRKGTRSFTSLHWNPVAGGNMCNRSYSSARYTTFAAWQGHSQDSPCKTLR
ncbi:hypothetical protein PENFLA_c018G07011 [Penicillium flavigenum]|uniref:Uncharacterized protein n=1 Tax=Penicillium flavigenum TaxID=254877 RepID=A0A1V6SZX5_9EURO|nr:hypothetical protein PENFLA_c018G07011 [Penicillium flavigenum]